MIVYDSVQVSPVQIQGIGLGLVFTLVGCVLLFAGTSKRTRKMKVGHFDWYTSRRGSLFMTLFCSVFLIVGLMLACRTIDVSLRFVETEGVVIERKTWSDPDTWGYAYKIQFVEQRTGRQIIANVSLGNGQEYSVGQKLTILYNPEILNDIVVKDLLFFYLIPIGLTGIGGIGTFAFFRLFIRSNKTN